MDELFSVYPPAPLSEEEQEAEQQQEAAVKAAAVRRSAKSKINPAHAPVTASAPL